MSIPPTKLTVTAVFDEPSKSFTAFFNELPGLLVQGNSFDDVKQKLRSLLLSYIKRLQNIANDFEIKTQSLYE